MKVMLFARARDVIGAESVLLDVLPGATVAELRQVLARQFPTIANLIARSAIAVNNDYAAEDRTLDGQEEIALLPPVSGG